MFAYCGNNPVNRLDLTGYEYDSAIVRKGIFHVEITHTYDGVRKHYYNSGWFSDLYQEIGSIKEQLNEAESLEEYVAVAKRILDYEIVANSVATYKTPSGLKKIKDGFGLILLPAPTLIDEVLGLVQIIWGFSSFLTGIGELLEWDGD